MCLNYTNGGSTQFQSSYVGFYLWIIANGTEKDCQLTTQPTINAWNDLQFVGNWGTGSAQLSIGGVSAGPACATGFASVSGAQALIGVFGNGNISTFGAYYDDIQVAVTH
jgi:hypothetical protein